MFVLQERVRALAEVGAEDLTLSLCGAPLEDACLVSELSSYELDLTAPLLGGKVHGSLARAGEYLLNFSVLNSSSRSCMLMILVDTVCLCHVIFLTIKYKFNVSSKFCFLSKPNRLYGFM